MKDAIKLTEHLANKICNKKIIFCEVCFRQDSNFIYAKHWTEALHEIAHFLASENRDSENLGLPFAEDENEREEWVLIEEAIALSLTKKLYDKYYSDIEYEERVKEYMNYFQDRVEYYSTPNTIDIINNRIKKLENEY